MRTELFTDQSFCGILFLRSALRLTHDMHHLKAPCVMATCLGSPDVNLSNAIQQEGFS